MPIYQNGLIIELFPHEILVVGTNSMGEHAGGAAAQAHRHFGLEWGVAAGLSGQTYAFPTMDGLEEIERYVPIFFACASANPEREFYVTALGCGIAGHDPKDVAPFFACPPKNVFLPMDFALELERKFA